MASEASHAPPRFNVRATARDWLREVRLIRGCLDAQVDRLDRLERELVTLIGSCDVDDDPSVLTDGPIAYNLSFAWRGDGSAAVSIDGGAKFVLPPQLAEVFQFIATGNANHRARDPLVGWRSRAEIAALLERSAHRSFTVSYVNNLVHRLRQVLRKAGYNGNLIQTHKHKGVRVAHKWVAGGLSSFSPEESR